MSEENTQAVVENADAQAAPAAGADNARVDDLDSALNEFDSQVAPVSSQQTRPEQTVQAADPMVQQLARELQELKKETAESKFKEAIAPVIKDVRGDIPAEILSDDEVLDLLNGRAQRDTRLAQAWLNRTTNPLAWKKVVTGLNREMQQKFSKLPDKNATEDVAAVTAAVRGASTRAPADTPPSFAGLNNNSYADEVEKRYGYRPSV